MIKELSDLGSKKRTVPADALQEEPMSIYLIVKREGSFDKFIPFEKKLTVAEAIIAKKGQSRLLLDKAAEVLGYGGDKSAKKHQWFMEKLESYKDLPELAPITAFYNENKKNGLETALAKFEAEVPEKERNGNIAFCILNKDARIHEEQNVHKRIICNYETKQKLLLSKSKKQCSICGKHDYPVVDIPHGMIKKVPDGQSSGCALVSYNKEAFESYDLDGNNNSGICTHCARNYFEGLKWLLISGHKVKVTDKKGKEKETFRFTNRKDFGTDTAMVFWTRENADLKEIDMLDNPDSQEVANLIDSVASGDTRNADYIQPDQFYACTLSGSAARISVRDWIETSLVDFRKSIAQWFKDIAIEYFDFDTKESKTQYSRLFALAQSCQRKNQNGMYDKNDITVSRTAAYLWNVALKNTSPPRWILVSVLKRAQLDKYGVTPERAALIKLILNRSKKGGDFMVSEKLTEGNRPVAYVCGQIFAELEDFQRAALGKNLNAGIREKYFSFALTTPSAAFGRLFNLHSKHFTKLKGEKPGLAIVLDRELQKLCKDIKIEYLPATFTLDEQGQFAIGYYHQKQAPRPKTELNETEEEE